MKKLKKAFFLLLIVSMIFGTVERLVFAAETGSEEIGWGSVDEPSGFDENAHGKLIEEGECGENVNYKLYEDETLYICGIGEITGKTDFESRFSEKYVSNVYVENGISGIGKSAFDECKDIKTVRLPEGIKEIAYYGFAYCESLKEINLSDSIENIDKCAFFYCRNLTEINIPKEITEIQEMAFSCCSNLKTVFLPEKLKTIGKSAFNLCNSMEEIALPEGLETIGESAFLYTGLKTVAIPDTITLIDSNAFSQNPNLTRVLIPDTIKKIRNGAVPYNSGKLTIYCNENTEAERYAKENNIPYKPTSMWGEPEIANTFNGCKGSPVKLSITCKESDEFTFECMDNCEMQSKYTGYSSIQLGGLSSYSKSYELTFAESGEHIISVCKNGRLMENDKIVVAEEHTWDSGEVDKKETCTENGAMKYTCYNCEDIKIEEISATGHQIVEDVSVPATCAETGKTEGSHCSVCGETIKEQEIIPATGHSYEQSFLKKSTCEAEGIKKYACVRCADSYDEIIPKIDHTPGKWSTFKKPTIFRRGKQKIICTACGKNLQGRDIEKLKASVKISKNKLKLKKEKAYQLRIKKKSKDDKVSKWTTSNKEIVSVNKKTGKIRALKKGKSKITVRMKSGCKATCNVTVK